MRAPTQQGFILAVVLWSIAALTLITGGIMARVNLTLEQAYRLRDLAQQERDLLATEQTLLFLLSSRPRNAAGVVLAPGNRGASPLARDQGPGPTLRLDGSLYAGVGTAGFTLQDLGAAFSLMEPERDTWHRFTALLGVEPSRADRWRDQILDYQDRDDIAGLHGAEADTYRRLGLPPPPNRFMVSPHELRNLPFALEYPELTERLIRLATTTAGNAANLNTSPAEVLRLRHKLSAGDCIQLIQTRQTYLIPSPERAAELGILFQHETFGSVWRAGTAVRIMLGRPDGRQKRWIAVHFTPDADGRPWDIEYNHPVDFHYRQQEPDTDDAFRPSGFRSDATPAATDWTSYQAFFPEQLPVDG